MESKAERFYSKWFDEASQRVLLRVPHRDALGSASYFGSEQSTTSFMYFSLTTITTLGYGDLAPQTDVGRLLATSEAVIGQVYLVTFVALVVGLFVQHRERRPDPNG